MTDRPSTRSSSLSLSRHDASTSSEQFSEAFFRRIAERAGSALDVPVVILKFAAPETLWVAVQDDAHDGAALSAQLQESTLFRRITRPGDVVVDDVWAEDRFTALVDLEQFAFRFVAGVTLTDEDEAVVGQLCVLDDRARSLEAHHRDVLGMLAEMAQGELARQQEAARRRRGDALRNRLQRVLQMIARDEPIEVTLEALMYLVETQFPGFAATVHWLGPEALLRPVAAPSVPPAFIDATDGLPADAEAGSVGAAVHDGEEVLDADAVASIHWPDMRAAVEAAGFRASWSFPVRSSEGRAVLGALTLFSEEAMTPTDEMRQTVAIAAQIAAVALERDHDRSLLERMQERHARFLRQCGEGAYRIELSPPVAVDQSVETQIRQVFERAHVAECNDVFAHQHGFATAGDLIGRPLLDLYGEGQDLAQLPVLRAVDHGYTLDDAASCEVDQQGRQRWFNNRIEGAVEDGRLVAFWGAQRDVTRQRHTEYALRESEHRYRTLVELDPTLVMVHREGRIQYVNPAGARLLGATEPEEVQGRPLTDFLREGACERLVHRARSPEATEDPAYHTCVLTRLDGSTRSVAMASSHILHRGNPTILTVAHDVAGVRNDDEGCPATSSPVHATNDAEASFVTEVTEEIRTPLTAIIGFTEILGEELAEVPSPDIRDLVDHIRSNGQWLLWTLDSISNLSRIETGGFTLHPVPVDVGKEAERIAETFGVMARGKDVTIELPAEPSPVRATLDRGAFERVVGNLLVHAIHEAADGTVALYACETDRGPAIVVEETRAAGDAPHAGATNIGMTVVERLLNMMGGALEIEAQPEGEVVYTAYFGSADEVALRQALHLLPEGAASAA